MGASAIPVIEPVSSAPVAQYIDRLIFLILPLDGVEHPYFLARFPAG